MRIHNRQGTKQKILPNMQQPITKGILRNEVNKNEDMPIPARHSMRTKKMLLVMPIQKTTKPGWNKIPSTNMHIRRQMQIQRTNAKTKISNLQILRQKNTKTTILLKPANRIKNMAKKTQTIDGTNT